MKVPLKFISKVFDSVVRSGSVLVPVIVLAAVVVFPAGLHAADDVIHVYSHRHYDADRQLFERFEDKTGIEVKVLKASADELINRIEMEGAETPADLLITVDAGRLWRAQEKGLLQPVESAKLKERVPDHLRDPKGRWFGLTKRARVVVYSKDRVQPKQLSTYEALTDEKWRGRIAIRSSKNIYNQSLLASLIAHHGERRATAWAAGMVENFARRPRGNDRDQIKAVAAGLADLAVVNTYYLGLLQNSDSRAEREVADAVGIFFPNQGGRGAHVNISGAGVVKHAKNRENAVKLLEFLTSPDAQAVFAGANYEYPVHPEVEWSAQLKAWGTFKEDDLTMSELGRHNDEAVRIFDRVGWR